MQPLTFKLHGVCSLLVFPVGEQQHHVPLGTSLSFSLGNCSVPLSQKAVAGNSPPAAGTEAAARAADVDSKSLCLFLSQDELLREFGLPCI